MSDNTLLLGAVAYDPKVVTIWDGFIRYFARHGFAFDYVLHSNYERQVEAHLAGHFHVAWNSPLAWLQTISIGSRLGRSAEAICMRDSDRDLTSLILIRSDSGIQSIADLAGKRVALGAKDSPQATLIPLEHLATNGLVAGENLFPVYFDVLAGKHGDHIGGERDGVRALVRGEVDAACLIDSNYLAFAREGTIPPGAAKVLSTTPAYDHCNFTVLDGAPAGEVARFRELLLGMSYADADVRPLLDMEGLKQWLPGRTSGYSTLQAAVDRFRTIEPFANRVVAARR